MIEVKLHSWLDLENLRVLVHITLDHKAHIR